MSEYFNPFDNYDEKEEVEIEQENLLMKEETKPIEIKKEEVKIADAKKYFKKLPNNNTAVINLLKNSNISDNSIIYIIKILISKIKDENTKEQLKVLLN